MPSYVSVPIETDPDALAELAFDYMESVTGGLWTPADGNLDVWILIACANMAAELRDVASDVPTTIFRYLGSQIFGIVPDSGVAALGTTTWTMRDSTGYPIPAGTVVGLRDANGDLVYFEVTERVDVAPGQTVAAGVQINALDETAAANGLTGPNVELIDELDYVASVVLAAATSGGADEEDDDAYLDRLTRNMRLLAPRPIVADDFAMMARNITGVYRAVAIDNYNPADGTTNNERMVAVAGIDANGAALSALVKSAVQIYLSGNREANFIVNVIDPNFNVIDVTVVLDAFPQYDKTDVQARVTSAIQDFLNPINWGSTDSGDVADWTNQTTINEYDISTAIKNTQGVKQITSLTFRKPPAAFASTSIALTGVAPLPQAGTLSVTVN